jgi:hypothetical protein
VMTLKLRSGSQLMPVLDRPRLKSSIEVSKYYFLWLL